MKLNVSQHVARRNQHVLVFQTPLLLDLVKCTLCRENVVGYLTEALNRIC